MFRGVVLSDGKPVPNAELEIAYLNHAARDGAKRRFATQPHGERAAGCVPELGILTNDRGEFTIGLPRAGWWGICALGVGARIRSFKGKALSQDAVLWFRPRT